MPEPVYMSIEGAKQGNISSGATTEDSIGNKWIEGHEDEIIVQAFKHNIEIPRDPQSGQPTGTRVHKPCIITKIVDKSSPLLFNALTSGEKLPKVEIKWFRISQEGEHEHYFTTTLTDAIIVDITAYMPNRLDSNLAQYGHMEDVAMTYRKIEWEHVVASTNGADDYRKPAGS